MQITTRQLVFQHAHILQQELFPRLTSALGWMGPELKLLTSVCALVPLQARVGGNSRLGRRPKDRLALVTAFIAKAILNLPTTSQPDQSIAGR